MDNNKTIASSAPTFGDIYGQIIIWLITITLSLASAMAMMGARRPYYA